MDSPETSPPPAAIQNRHDDNPKSKPCATNTNNPNNPTKIISLVTKTAATNPTKNNPHKQISNQVTFKNNKNDNGNTNTDPNISTGNDKNTVYNRRIEHATTTIVTNNRFTTKWPLTSVPKHQIPS